MTATMGGGASGKSAPHFFFIGAPRAEIVLATAHRLIVEGPFDADALARLLSVLARP